jgi:mono/diheme cytochrome c family protein
VKRIHFILVTLLALGGLTLAMIAYVRTHGFSARTEPSALETFVARRVRSLAVPVKERDAVNPVAASPEVLAEAMEHFADHCAVCHANDGSGNTPIGRGLSPKAPDMRLGDTQSLKDGEIYYIIHNGIRFTGMPAFGEDRAGKPDEDSWKLVHFIRHLPKITEEELQTMKRLNPKNPAELAEEERIRRFLAGEDVPEAPEHHRH